MKPERVVLRLLYLSHPERVREINKLNYNSSPKPKSRNSYHHNKPWLHTAKPLRTVTLQSKSSATLISCRPSQTRAGDMGKGTADKILTAVHTSADRYTLVSLDTRYRVSPCVLVSLQARKNGATPLVSLGF